MIRVFVILSTIVLIVFLLSTIYVFTSGNYREYEDIIDKYSAEYGLDKDLILAICRAESNFDPSAVSEKGAIGIMQIMPETAEYVAKLYDFQYDKALLYDAEYNVMIGCAYLNYLRKKFEDDIMIAAYNAGEGIVEEWEMDGVIRYRETQKYIKKVKFFKWVYKL